MNNTKANDILEHKANALAQCLLNVSFSVIADFQKYIENEESKEIREKLDPLIRNKMLIFHRDVLFFLLHYADRVAYQILGSEKRNSFMHLLISKTYKLLEQKVIEYARDGSRDEFMIEFDKFNRRFGIYPFNPVHPNKDDYHFLMELTIRIADTLVTPMTKSMMFLPIIIGSYLKSLNLQTFFVERIFNE